MAVEAKARLLSASLATGIPEHLKSKLEIKEKNSRYWLFLAQLSSFCSKRPRHWIGSDSILSQPYHPIMTLWSLRDNELYQAFVNPGNQSSSSSNSNRGHRPNCALSDLDDSSGMSDHLHHTENSKQMHRDQQYFRDVPPKAQLSPETRRHSVGVQDARRQMIREHTIRSQRRHSSKPINGVYEREKVQPRPDIFSKTRQVQLGYLDETEGWKPKNSPVYLPILLYMHSAQATLEGFGTWK